MSQLRSGGGSLAMIRAAVARGDEVWVAPLDELSVGRRREIGVRAARVEKPEARVVRRARPELITLDADDRVILRVNPARAKNVDVGLGLLAAASPALSTVNDAGALLMRPGKSWLFEVPEALRPPTILSRSALRIRAFVHDVGRAVIKPLVGSGGRDVFILDPKQPENLRALVDAAVRRGPVVAQAFIPEVREGDLRVWLVDGRVLTVDGLACAFRRVPGDGELRCNLGLGATPRPVDAAAVPDLGPLGAQLVALGVRMAAVDVAGGRVLEVNVHSPGGLVEAEKLLGVDFSAGVVGALADAP